MSEFIEKIFLFVVARSRSIIIFTFMIAVINLDHVTEIFVAIDLLIKRLINSRLYRATMPSFLSPKHIAKRVCLGCEDRPKSTCFLVCI